MIMVRYNIGYHCGVELSVVNASECAGTKQVEPAVFGLANCQ